ncbi:hypothetical protein BOO69_20480 (plasmid) [Sulfitobacter alexandrii]|uniref:Sulfotransferase family protein n=1 Tax=Sulfitobacter alexandrii TaxID=1917485 RepID=A0A1J0WNP9_9RHOB|nr:hypothetical protein [Sulfitobacter alexandrii]APE45938.1 hypothetical protein BOO69_20480 [Sulfitobacter alexandrii]
MSQLIVHAGFPKCGSTAIFAGLQQQFDSLSAQKIHLLNRSFEPAPRRQLAQPPLWELESAMSKPAEARDIKEKILDALGRADPDARLILSSENLANKNAPKRLLEGIDAHFPVTAIFYIRPQVDWIPSAWKQWDMREGLTLRDTVEKYFELRRPPYLAVLRAWQEAMPATRIILRPLVSAELAHGDPIRDFYDQIDATYDTAAPPAPKTNVNPSIDHALMHLMMRSHDLFFSGRHDSAFMMRLLDHLPDKYKRTNAAMLSQLTCSDIFDTYFEENLTLASEFMRMEDARGFLNRHFRRTVEGEPYETMSEDRVMGRAERIIEEVFDVTAPRDRLAQALRDAVEARSAG